MEWNVFLGLLSTAVICGLATGSLTEEGAAEIATMSTMIQVDQTATLATTPSASNEIRWIVRECGVTVSTNPSITSTYYTDVTTDTYPTTTELQVTDSTMTTAPMTTAPMTPDTMTTDTMTPDTMTPDMMTIP